MRWPLQPLQPLQQTQLQPLFGQSVDSLCHPWFTTTNVSYRFPILKLPPPPCAVLLVLDVFGTPESIHLYGVLLWLYAAHIRFLNPKHKLFGLWLYIYIETILLFGHIIFLTLEPEIDYLIHVCVRKASRIHWQMFHHLPSMSCLQRCRNDPGSEANGWVTVVVSKHPSHSWAIYCLCIWYAYTNLNTGHHFLDRGVMETHSDNLLPAKRNARYPCLIQQIFIYS